MSSSNYICMSVGSGHYYVPCFEGSVNDAFNLKIVPHEEGGLYKKLMNLCKGHILYGPGNLYIT